jgi:hypothetical protein
MSVLTFSLCASQEGTKPVPMDPDAISMSEESPPNAAPRSFAVALQPQGMGIAGERAADGRASALVLVVLQVLHWACADSQRASTAAAGVLKVCQGLCSAMLHCSLRLVALADICCW